MSTEMRTGQKVFKHSKSTVKTSSKTEMQTFLIVCATGTQGSSVITALLATAPSSEPIQILALTRNTSSAKAKALAESDSRIKLLQGDPTSPELIFQSAGPIDAVFCVTVHGPPGAEESQAQGLIDASIAHGVKHFVFTSADRGGEILSNTNPTPVAHIATKHHIELYLKAKTAQSGMTWTILRPVTFMDNLTPDFAGKGFAAMWNQVGKKPIQVVAASDIGIFAAKALLDQERYAGRAIGIAGDELNFEDACKVFKEVMGVEMPTTFCAVGSVLKIAMKDIGTMFKWFEKDGYNVDIKAAREEYPELQDFASWLKKGSGFKVKP
ncbi:putative NmrA-like family domain-containing protein 1 [Mycena floridula]|nr:putative NmrA-like family domain-containing protein 1 [Mycena floridula]